MPPELLAGGAGLHAANIRSDTHAALHQQLDLPDLE
jgi:hypothetical protein